MKTLLNIIRSRKEIKFRKWCIEKAVKVSKSDDPRDFYYIVEYIYEWTKSMK